jgi:tRNA uracil 4-sulfurtransferase
MATILVRYGEIALKGKNRGQFEQQLHRNLKGALQDLDATVTRHHGRFSVHCPDSSLEESLIRLGRIFGLVSFSPVCETTLEIEAIKEAAAGMVQKLPAGDQTFKIKARRSNKDFPYNSPELNQILGAHLLQSYPELKVKIDDPSFTLEVEIGYQKTFLYLERIPGPGGLPVGSSGRALLLLSGGIDSPAAGWLAMKRGLSLEAVHFHSFPYTSRRSQEKAVDLCRKLALYGYKIPLHQVSVTKIQEALRKNCPEELGVILLRRMMMRLAEKLCRVRVLKALVTGENLGQVASQTLESIDTISKATQMLILRPLIGFDKLEISELAIKIDTYETSILPYEDCCTLFVPASPVTRPKLGVVEKYEQNIDLDDLVEEALKTLETEIIRL